MLSIVAFVIYSGIPHPGKESGRVVVLTHRFWRSHYGGQPNVVGKSIELNREPYTVIAVVPPRFDNYLGNVIVPIHLKFDPGFAWGVQARLKPGVSRSTAELRLSGLLTQFAREAPQRFPSELRVQLTTLLEQRKTAGSIPTLISLFAAAALLLLVVCANVSILLLARGKSRQHELAVRHSIGASRLRLLGQLLTEALVLALAGTSVGVILAYWGLPFVLRWLPPGSLPVAPAAIHVNLPVLLFSVGLAGITSVLFGLWPAVSFSRPHLSPFLQSAPNRAAGNIRSRRAHHFLMAIQVALTVLILAGTGAAVRGLLSYIGRTSDTIQATCYSQQQILPRAVILNGRNVPPSSIVFGSRWPARLRWTLWGSLSIRARRRDSEKGFRWRFQGRYPPNAISRLWCESVPSTCPRSKSRSCEAAHGRPPKVRWPCMWV